MYRCKPKEKWKIMLGLAYGTYNAHFIVSYSLVHSNKWMHKNGSLTIDEYERSKIVTLVTLKDSFIIFLHIWVLLKLVA